jgi:hypothetical protein
MTFGQYDRMVYSLRHSEGIYCLRGGLTFLYAVVCIPTYKAGPLSGKHKTIFLSALCELCGENCF